MDLTIGRFLRFVIAIFILAVIGWFLYTLSNIITIMIISALLAYILDPIASYLEARGLSRVQATVIIFSILFLIIGLSTWLLIPKLIHEMSTIQQGGGSGQKIQFLVSLENFISTRFSFIDPSQLNFQEKFTAFTSGLSEQIVAFIPNMVSVIMVAVIIPFVVFFLLKDGRNMKKQFISYVPNRYFEMTLNVLHKIDMQLGGYLRGQFIEAFVIGLLAVIALGILQVKYFTIIGMVAGLANMVPYVGPVAGAVPAIIVTLANDGDPMKLVYIVIAFAIVQLIDNILVQPLVLSKSVNLHPLVIVFAVLIGGQFFGLLGMLLAVPTAGIIKVTFMELYNAIRKYHLI
jgi:putative permease